MSALWPRPRCWISVPFREGDGEYLCDLFCAILGKTGGLLVETWWRGIHDPPSPGSFTSRVKTAAHDQPPGLSGGR